MMSALTPDTRDTIVAIYHDLDLNLDDITTTKVVKLASRMERNKLTGSGDDR